MKTLERESKLNSKLRSRTKEKCWASCSPFMYGGADDTTGTQR